jgi:L-seryl-tRNA(Ser) seleniumtransferase
MTAAPGSGGAVGAELRKLPHTELLHASAGRAGAIARLGHERVVDPIRSTLEGVRERVRAGAPCPSPDAIEAEVLLVLERAARGTLRRAVNATGVVLHTNLGRAPLSDEAVAAMATASGYATLEYDLEAGRRGDRHVHAAALLRRLTGAEDAAVVNNNGGAAGPCGGVRGGEASAEHHCWSLCI